MIGNDTSNKKKGIAFKDSTKSEEELNNEDIALLSRKFKHFFNKNSSTSKWEGSTQKRWKEKSMCFKVESLDKSKRNALSQKT